MQVLKEIRTAVGKLNPHEVQAAADRWFTEGVQMFGTGTSKRDWKYIKWGLKQRTNQLARAEYKAEAEGVLRELGLQVPEIDMPVAA